MEEKFLEKVQLVVATGVEPDSVAKEILLEEKFLEKVQPVVATGVVVGWYCSETTLQRSA